ncbi:hypothetical protein JW865_03210 [Candidatus Bathyarchaeota archaeon]|nr:hypothetical protein [Candidatus Bathyarchaeota archaeon]
MALGNINDDSDELIENLVKSFKKLELLDGAERLIPEVGLNIVYSKPFPKDNLDVLGLDGRVIVSEGKPHTCGVVKYGGSSYLSSVLLKANQINPKKRAAVVIKGRKKIADALIQIGKKVTYLSSESSGEGCPVTNYLANQEELTDAYSHLGAFGIEPTTTILADDLDELLIILKELLNYV